MLSLSELSLFVFYTYTKTLHLISYLAVQTTGSGQNKLDWIYIFKFGWPFSLAKVTKGHLVTSLIQFVVIAPPTLRCVHDDDVCNLDYPEPFGHDTHNTHVRIPDEWKIRCWINEVQMIKLAVYVWLVTV